MTNRRQFIVKASAVLAALLGVKVAAAEPLPEVHGEWFFQPGEKYLEYGIIEFQSGSVEGIEAVICKLLGRVNRDEIDGRKPGTLLAESMSVGTLMSPSLANYNPHKPIRNYIGKMKLLYKAEGWNNVLGRQVVDAKGNRKYQDVRFSL